MSGPRPARKPNNARKPSVNVYTPWWLPLSFAGSVLGVGVTVAFLSILSSQGGGSAQEISAGPLPGWVFWAVWLIIYPAMGVSTFLVWRKRREADVRLPLALSAVAFLQNLSFWLSRSLGTTVAIDAIGLVLAYFTAWVYSRTSRAAATWLLPWLVWMPITTVLKFWMWVYAR